MILCDTNILIDFFNSPSNAINDIFIKENIAICGVVQAELLHGVRTQEQINDTIKMFSGLEYLEMGKEDWIPFGLFLLKLRKAGLSIPFADAIIAYIGIKNDCPIWTSDKHFSFIKEKVPELKLYIPYEL